MANRIAAFNTFAGVAPPWSLPNLDANFSSIFGAFNDASLGWNNYIATDSGSANNYIVATVFGTPSVYNVGMRVTFLPAHTNNGASVINVNALGSTSILRPDGTALLGGEIVAAVSVDLIYTGSAFIILVVPNGPIVANLGGISSNQTVACKYGSSVIVTFGLQAANLTIVLTGLAQSVPVFFACTGTTSTTSFAILGSTPTYTALYIQQGVVGTQSSFAITAGKALFGHGAASGSQLFMIGQQSA